MPSNEVFSNTIFSSATLQKRMRELAFLNQSLTIILLDKTGKKEKEFKNKYDGGVQEFVEYLDKNKKSLVNKSDTALFKKPIYISGEKSNVVVECSLKWNAAYSEDVLPFTNNIHQKDGGTHLLGFRSALTRVINKYATSTNILKKNNLTLSGEDTREGLTGVLSIKVPDPKFSSQTQR